MGALLTCVVSDGELVDQVERLAGHEVVEAFIAGIKAPGERVAVLAGIENRFWLHTQHREQFSSSWQ